MTYEQRGQGHVLVVPIEHRITVLDLAPVERSALMDDVVRVTNAIVNTFDPDGVAVWQNNGITANQSIPHVHFHVAGTIAGGGTVWGDVPQLSLAATDEIADRLRPHLRACERS